MLRIVMGREDTFRGGAKAREKQTNVNADQT